MSRSQPPEFPDSLLLDTGERDETALPKGLTSIPKTSAPVFTLYELVRVMRPRSILEIGTQHGVSATMMAFAQRDAGLEPRVTCVDPFLVSGDNDGLGSWVRWYDWVAKSGLGEHIILMKSRFEAVSDRLWGPFDFVFVDGCHDYENVVHDLASGLSLLSDSGLAVVHDYVFYESVRRACDHVVDRHPLWTAVNSVQRNHRGEVCGWLAVRFTPGVDREALQREAATAREGLLRQVAQPAPVRRQGGVRRFGRLLRTVGATMFR